LRRSNLLCKRARGTAIALAATKRLVGFPEAGVHRACSLQTH
jgi:hypothetical protein